MFLATTIIALAAIQPSLVFVARFYKPGSAKSQFELYVSDLAGGNRKLLKTTEEPVSVQWVGHDRLLWLSESALWTSKLSPWKPLLVKKSTTLHFERSRDRISAPGMPELIEDFDRTKGLYGFNVETLKVDQMVETPHHTDIDFPEDGDFTIPDPNHDDHPIKGKRFDGFSYFDKGKETKSEWDIFRAWRTDGNSKLWALIGSHTSSSGDINGIMLFEKGKSPRTIFEDGNCFDFWPERSTFAYCTSRDTSNLGKKQVWTSALHVGDWKKGTNKTVLNGVIWVPSVSIRP